jgi:valyl-tRNA synthetase
MWNATKFVLMQLGQDFAPAAFADIANPGADRHPMEKWILSRLNAAIIQSNEGLASYQFSKVCFVFS